VLTEERTISIRIPPGIESGTRLRISGAGEPGADGHASGDLYVTVQVDEHSEWARQGCDIQSEMTLDLAQAVLGDTVAVETLTGPVQLRIPRGTQPETVFKLKGCGVPRGKGGERGDHLVRVHVDVPRNLSEDARRHFEQFAGAAGLESPGD
jgi:molecular chaperone DnaJ